MALTYGEISATTQKYYIPKLIDNIFGSNSLLQRWRKKNYKAESGGTVILQPLLYATTTAAGWYSGTDTLSTTANDQITAGEWSRAHVYAAIPITHTDELANSGDAQVIDMVAAKVQAAEMTLADTMGTGLFNLGTDTKAVVGLRLAVDSTGTYAGINRSSYSWWASQEDGTNTTVSMAVLQSMFGDCTVGNDKPSVEITTQDLLDYYTNLLTPLQRFVDEETAAGGFTNVMHNGVPVIADSHCPSAHWFMLNEKYLSLMHHPKDNFRFEPFTKPVNQNMAVAHIYWAGQLVCSNCRMQGKLNALTA